MSSRRRRRTRPTGSVEQAIDQEIEAQLAQDPPTDPTLIPDEEIDAEDAETQARVAEEDQALAEVEAEAGVETLPANDPSEQIGDVLADQANELMDEEGLGDDEYDSDEVENYTDTFPNPVEQEPDFDPEIFERGPLAAGIRMLEALLTEARAGYITAQIGELERVLDEQIGEGERVFLGQVAAQERTPSGLPDVAGAYRALVRARVQAGA